MIREKCVGFSGSDQQVECTAEKAILYALGIGASKDPLDQKDLSFTYEQHEDFQVQPTLGGLTRHGAGGVGLVRGAGHVSGAARVQPHDAAPRRAQAGAAAPARDRWADQTKPTTLV